MNQTVALYLTNKVDNELYIMVQSNFMYVRIHTYKRLVAIVQYCTAQLQVNVCLHVTGEFLVCYLCFTFMLFASCTHVLGLIIQEQHLNSNAMNGDLFARLNFHVFFTVFKSTVKVFP